MTPGFYQSEGNNDLAMVALNKWVKENTMWPTLYFVWASTIY